MSAIAKLKISILYVLESIVLLRNITIHRSKLPTRDRPATAPNNACIVGPPSLTTAEALMVELLEFTMINRILKERETLRFFARSKCSPSNVYVLFVQEQK